MRKGSPAITSVFFAADEQSVESDNRRHENRLGEYVLLTKFWNERNRIPSFINHVKRQTRLPLVWLLIDDGSTDGSGDLFAEMCENRGIPALVTRMPRKKRGNLDALGRAYTRAFKEHREELESFGPKYLGLLDVDTRLPYDYYERIMMLLDTHPEIGCAAGTIVGEPSRPHWPRGSGKVVRWEILRSIDEFWDIDADSFLNIKALRMGYRLTVDRSIKIRSAPSAIRTRKGLFRLGRVNYYERRHPLLVLHSAIMLHVRGSHGTDYLRGYFQEWAKNTWECKDMDVRYFYSLEYLIRDFLRRRGFSRHRWPVDPKVCYSRPRMSQA